MKTETKVIFKKRDLEDLLYMFFGENFNLQVEQIGGNQWQLISKSEKPVKLDHHGRIGFIILQAHKLGLKMMEVDKEKFAKAHGSLGIIELEGTLEGIANAEEEKMLK